MTTDAALMKARLAPFKDFQECVLRDIRWREFALSVDFIFNNIWDRQGGIRKDLGSRDDLVTVSFNLIQEFRFRAGLNESMCRKPELINWGINEVATIQILDDSATLEPYRSLPIPFHHAVISWEWERRIDMVFSSMLVVPERPSY